MLVSRVATVGAVALAPALQGLIPLLVVIPLLPATWMPEPRTVELAPAAPTMVMATSPRISQMRLEMPEPVVSAAVPSSLEMAAKGPPASIG